MTEGNITFAIVLLGWAAWSLSNISARVGRIADALDALRRLAERGRR